MEENPYEFHHLEEGSHSSGATSYAANSRTFTSRAVSSHREDDVLYLEENPHECLDLEDGSHCIGADVADAPRQGERGTGFLASSAINDEVEEEQQHIRQHP